MSSDGAKLISAAIDNDLASVKSLLATVEVDSRDWDNLTPLIAAAGKGHLEMVFFMIYIYILLYSYFLLIYLNHIIYVYNHQR